MERVRVAAWRSYWWAGLASALAIILTLAPVSHLAIHPIDVHIKGETVFVHRAFPGDTIGARRPLISYIETVKGFSQETNEGHICKNYGGPFRYSEAQSVGQWSIPWAAECLNDPIGYVWEACWRWHVGAMRFGAVCLDKTVMRASDDISAIDCPYRVSTRGLVHGPDSPWWSSTMPHHCFSTERAAREFAEEHVR